MAAPGRFGTSPRGAFEGPRFDNLDLSLLREIPLSNAQRLRFELQIFNVFNTALYNLPVANFDSRAFSQIQQANAGPPRQVQIGIKYAF